MSTVKPFKAVRPAKGRESEVTCLPYDVFYDHEVPAIIAANPNSFLKVTRPEGDIDPDVHPTRDEIFQRGKDNLDAFIRDGVFIEDDEPCFYVYRLTENGHSQTGVIGVCSLDEYRSGTIKRHEFTRPDKVADRTDHMIAVGAQTGLIFLTFRGTDRTRSLIADAIGSQPLYDLTADNGIRHEVWRVTNVDEWGEAFESVPALYVADGHHRLESAARARDILRESDAEPNADKAYNYVVAGIFPAEDLHILAYNRVVADLNGLTSEQFIERLKDIFNVDETDVRIPTHAGHIQMYLDGRWYGLRYNVDNLRDPGPIDRLDVSILQQNVLGPILNIQDPRKGDRIAFIGGRRGVDELERLVNSGISATAFSMFPTTMDDLLAVSDTGEVMPPKSTWFEPKLRDGIVVYKI